MQNAISIPIINILKETANEILRSGFERVGLLGTEMTIKSKIYDNALKNVEVITLSRSEQKETTRIILNILAGKKCEEDKELLKKFIQKLKGLGAERVILGCTELPLLIKNKKDVLDTLQVLAEATVRQSTDGLRFPKLKKNYLKDKEGV